MVRIKGMEMPSSCNLCKFHKLVLPADPSKYPSIVCIITGRVIFGENQECENNFFIERDEKCGLEEDNDDRYSEGQTI